MLITIRRLLFAVAAAYVFPGCAVTQRPSLSEGPQPLLQLRLASESQRADHDLMRLASGNRSVFVSRNNVAADDVMDSVVARLGTDGALLLEVKFSEAGAEKLSNATRLSEGAEMAVLLDSELLASAPIMSHLTLRRLVIRIEVPAAKATRLKEKIDRRWPK